MALTIITFSILILINCKHENVKENQVLSTPKKLENAVIEPANTNNTIEVGAEKIVEDSAKKEVRQHLKSEPVQVENTKQIAETNKEEPKRKKYYDFGISPRKEGKVVKNTTKELVAEPKRKKQKTIIEEKKLEKKPTEKTANPVVQSEPKKVIQQVINDQENFSGRGKISFEHTEFDFGQIIEGDKKDFKFSFTNSGKEDLEILKAVPSCGCTLPSFPFIPLEPGETGFIGVTYNSVGKMGNQTPEIEVYTNIRPEPFILTLKGIVLQKEKEDLDTELEAEASTDTIK